MYLCDFSTESRMQCRLLQTDQAIKVNLVGFCKFAIILSINCKIYRAIVIKECDARVENGLGKREAEVVCF